MGLLAAVQRARFEEQVGRLRTLQEALRWAFAASPPLAVADVVVQDEYSHDVVLKRPDGLYLCLDTT